MKQKTIYKCEHCGMEFESANDCLIHEKKHTKVEVKVGDRVNVISVGKIYDTYWKFFIENQLPLSLLARYQYDRFDIDPTKEYIVEYIGNETDKICVIKEGDYGRVFLIRIGGVEKAD